MSDNKTVIAARQRERERAASVCRALLLTADWIMELQVIITHTNFIKTQRNFTLDLKFYPKFGISYHLLGLKEITNQKYP